MSDNIPKKPDKTEQAILDELAVKRPVVNGLLTNLLNRFRKLAEESLIKKVVRFVKEILPEFFEEKKPEDPGKINPEDYLNTQEIVIVERFKKLRQEYSGLSNHY